MAGRRMPVELLDELVVYHGSEARTIGLYYGDLTALSPEESVDILVVSAFPDNYDPAPPTVIGALDRKGISVEKLAASKAVDLRETCSCWLSHEIVPPGAGIQFKRILCFEPLMRGAAPEVVGDIFRSLVPFLYGQALGATVAMPLVASGNQKHAAEEMLVSLVDAAVHWINVGLPLRRLNVVECSSRKAAALQEVFSRIKGRYALPPPVSSQRFRYDAFISYARQDSADVSVLHDQILQRSPSARLFLDRKQLNTGMSWQHEIYEALDACRKVVAVLSPAYLQSKVCQEEFNIALARQRDSTVPILFPIYLYSAQLPTYMKILQYHDCREGDHGRLRSVCEDLVESYAPEAMRGEV
jgi:hypothetical protein